MLRTILSGLLFSILLMAAPLQAVELIVRDARNGIGIDEASILLDDTAVQLSALGHARWRVDQGSGLQGIRIVAPGYQTLESTLSLDERGRSWVFWLSPELAASPHPLADTEQALLHLSLVDADSLQAVAGAAVSILELDIHALSDEDGQVSLLLPQATLIDPAQTPGLDLQVLTSHGGGLRRSGIQLLPGVTELILDLDHEFRVEDMPHGLATDAMAQRQLAVATMDGHELVPEGLDVNQPPASIRVGFANASCTQVCCSIASCTHTCVMSLEEYVRRGLWREWIASWGQQTLRSGAIPYRSYGARHVFIPRAPSHDICSSACCQVSGTGTNSATNQAVAATAGIMLERNNAVFFAEYSAQNNAWQDPNSTLSCSNSDLSCGNGVVGSPALNWPCLSDSVAFNRSCFGHGRGMSQWGTHYWQQDHQRLWPWIVNHYYNASGSGSGLRTATMTRPLRIASASTRASAVAGDLLRIQVAASNLAAEAHTAVLIGASIRSAATGFISDPPGDQPVVMEPGPSHLHRGFALPPGLPTGTYDLYVSLYLDVDGNGAISSDDLAMHLFVAPGVLRIVDDRLFADGFGAP